MKLNLSVYHKTSQPLNSTLYIYLSLRIQPPVMNKFISLIFAFILNIPFYAHSQNDCKLNFGAALASDNSQRQDEMIPLLIKGDPGKIQKLVTELQGEFRYSTGDISSVSIQSKYIKTVASHSYVNRIEVNNPFSKIRPLHDSMLVNNRVLPVHAGTAPLAQAYKGDGVVMGFIDTGIDFSHPDFKDTAGKTRIKFLWDQSLSTSTPPLPYNYGDDFTASDIDNNLANAHLATAASYGGHGTHVASEGAGNGLAVNNYKGVAPNTDIIFVAANGSSINSIPDATNYIYTKAAQLGKPCVINCSLGDTYGSHDGKDLAAQLIKNLITAQTGRSFVAAAGNSGNVAFHLGYTVSTTDTNFTWFTGGAYIAMYADTVNFKNVKFAIGADKPGPNYSFRGRTSFTNITSHVGVLQKDTIWKGPKRICTMNTYGDLVNGVYSMEFQIIPDSAYYWRLMTTGSGKFDEWSTDVKVATLTDSTFFPALKKYIQPDFNSTLVSSFQCLDEVITVGNYINRNQHVDYDNVLQVSPTLIPGALDPSSSHGPTRDGRIKPDIAAPGTYQMGCIVLSLFSSYAHSALAVGGMHRNGNGTSAASPTVAGIAALYLQLDPSAGWQFIKNAITNCARIDTFTTANIPNTIWGYGKADAYSIMTGCVTNDNSIYYTVYDEVMIYPDPFFFETTIEIFLKEKAENVQLVICDVVGKKVNTIAINNSGKILFHRDRLPSGIYFCILRSGEKIIATKKMVITD